MTFLNAAILFGAMLAAIPILLHLLLKNKPKKLLFPALRLLRLKRKVNSRRLRLKHIWLLFLRVMLVLLIVLALARPSLPAANYAWTATDWIKTIVIFVLAFGAYFGIEYYWRKQNVSNQQRKERRIFLRSGVGLGTAVLFLLLVLWPYGSRILAQWNDPQPPVSENVPVSAVLIFDVSPSMSYRQDNLDRLEVARGYAEELVSRLPSESQISVTHSASSDPLIFLPELSAAKDRLESLTLSEASRTIDLRVRAAIEMQQRDRERVLEEMGVSPDSESGDRFLREIYLFTDLARHAWAASTSRTIQQLMEENPWLVVYLVDVSVNAPLNVSLGNPRLSSQTLSRGEPFAIQVDLTPTGLVPDQQTVELWIQDESGKLTKRDQRTFSLSEQKDAAVNFSYRLDRIGAVQGELRLVSSDPMLFDNRRYFSAGVQAAPRVLVISDQRERADLWMRMLAPEELRRQGTARYRPEWQPSSSMGRIEYSGFDLVCLLSVSQPTSEAWSQLETFVKNGGGLLIALGTKEIDAVAYQESASAQAIMPGLPEAFSRFTPPEFLDFSDRDHPVLERFDELGGAGALLGASVNYHWKVSPTEEANQVIAYTSAARDSALLEKLVGRGRVLLLTTAIEPDDWNDLATEALEFMIFSDFLLKHLNRQNAITLNYQVGDSSLLSIPEEDESREFVLTTPKQEQSTIPLEGDAEEIPLGPFLEAGRYRVQSRSSSFDLSLSANLAEKESDLTPLEQADLEDLFGPDRFGVARSLEELEPVVRSRRLGQEMVPLLLLLAAIVFGLEQISANRFYEEEQQEAVSPIDSFLGTDRSPKTTESQRTPVEV